MAKNMLGGKCHLCVGKLDPQAVARKLDEKDDTNELITKRKEVKKKRKTGFRKGRRCSFWLLLKRQNAHHGIHKH